MKNIRIVLASLGLIALAATGYSLANGKAQSPAGTDCCDGSSCCTAGAGCCGK